MPLTATTIDTDIVIATELCESDRAKEYYYCRFCGSEMKLVLPTKNVVKHFRHEPGADCQYGAESIEHLEAKQYFYNLYKDDPKYERVELESRLVGADSDRIGDVVLYPTSSSIKPTVIEIQNSSISTEEIESRFDDWNAADNRYAMMWIITHTTLKRGDPDAIWEIRVPTWIRTLHKIYMGRVYMFVGNGIYALHFDPSVRYGDYGGKYYLKTMRTIRVRRVIGCSILQTTSGGGVYGDTRFISRFFDKKFW